MATSGVDGFLKVCSGRHNTRVAIFVPNIKEIGKEEEYAEKDEKEGENM